MEKLHVLVFADGKGNYLESFKQKPNSFGMEIDWTDYLPDAISVPVELWQLLDAKERESLRNQAKTFEATLLVVSYQFETETLDNFDFSKTEAYQEVAETEDELTASDVAQVFENIANIFGGAFSDDE